MNNKTPTQLVRDAFLELKAKHRTDMEELTKTLMDSIDNDENDENTVENAYRECMTIRHDSQRVYQDIIGREAKERRVVKTAEPAAVIKTFKSGEHYSTRSICDHNCVFSYRVVSRTKKFLTLVETDHMGNDRGETFKRGVSVYEGAETCKPSGTYSMCPVLKA